MSSSRLFRIVGCVVVLFCGLLGARNSFAQTLSESITTIDTTPKPAVVASAPKVDSLPVPYSKDGIEDVVDYAAQDSMIYDIAGQKVYLYGKATVKQKDIDLKAAQIVVDNKNHVVYAKGVADKNGVLQGRPEFKDASQAVTSDSMRYNFQTKKGKVYGARTTQGDGYVIAEQAKIITIKASDSTHKSSNEFYSQNALFTTCNDPHPHFGILSSKQKVIPGKLVVVGPSQLVFGDVPTPLVLPFAFFPVLQGRRSGVIIPRDYESSQSLGFGFKNLGYYVAVSKNTDLSLTGDIYLRGSWRATLGANYLKRYKYRGNLSISTAYTVIDEVGAPEYSQSRPFNITWNHTQEAAAHPTRSFSASVNFGASSFSSTTRNDANSVLNNNLSSTVAFSQRFPASPFSLSAAFRHSQVASTHDMSVTLPSVNLNMTTLFPFKRKVAAATSEVWYEKIALSYGSRLENTLTTKDTTLFAGKFSELQKQVRAGIAHTAGLSASFLVAKYFSLTPSMNYNESWYFTSAHKTFDPSVVTKPRIITGPNGATETVYDTIQNGRVVSSNVFGFTPVRTLSSGASVSTQIFGTAQFGKHGYIRAIRHTVRPSFGYSYTPAFDGSRYLDSVQTTNRSRFKTLYSVFENNPIGGANTSIGKAQSVLTLNIANTLEAKVAKRGADSTIKVERVQLIPSFNISTSYNFAADSLKLSNINLNASTTLFKILNVNAAAVYSPYAIAANGAAYNRFAYDVSHRLAEFQSANLNIGTSFSSTTINNFFKPASTPKPNTPKPNTPTNLNSNTPKDFFSGFRVNYNLNVSAGKISGRDTLRVIQQVDLGGTMNLTNKWRIDIGRIGYDFVAQRITYPDITFYRDMHCWEMGLSWYPERKTYTFFLRAKPGTLDFLKVPYNKNQFDPKGF